MATPTLPSSYPIKYKQIIDVISLAGSEPITITYDELKKVRHERNYYYGYRRAVQLRYDKLSCQVNNKSTDLVQSELNELHELLRIIPLVSMSVDEKNLSITWYNRVSDEENDPLARALASRIKEQPATSTPVSEIRGLEVDEVILGDIMEMADEYDQPSDIVGDLPNTADLLGIKSTEIVEGSDIDEPSPAAEETQEQSVELDAEDVEKTPDRQPQDDITKRIAQLRTGYDNLNKKEKRNASQEDLYQRILQELTQLDETFIEPETLGDLVAIEKKSKGLNI